MKGIGQQIRRCLFNIKVSESSEGREKRKPNWFAPGFPPFISRASLFDLLRESALGLYDFPWLKINLLPVLDRQPVEA